MGFTNQALKKDLKELLEDPTNISILKKGTVSGNSIELQTIIPTSLYSYVYYENQALRDEEYNKLETLINNG